MGEFRRVFKRIINIFFEFLIVASIFSILQAHVFLLGFVPTPSMYPTVPVGSRIFALRGETKLKTGDLIVFEIPEMSDDYYIKRLIGLPDDLVEIKGGELYLNGEWLDIKALGAVGDLGGDLKSTETGFFVLGDNLNNSLDSRFIGRISPERFVAKVVFHKAF